MSELEENDEKKDGNSDNIFEIMQKQAQKSVEYKPLVVQVSENGSDTPVISKKDAGFRNLPGLHLSVSHAAHVAKDSKHKQQTQTPPESPVEHKRPRLVSPQTPRLPDPCISPDTGKRRRIQHDYRRLSNSGYLDDYVAKERRYSSTDSEMSPSTSPVKPRLVAQPTNPVKVNGTVNGSVNPQGND